MSGVVGSITEEGGDTMEDAACVSEPDWKIVVKYECPREDVDCIRVLHDKDWTVDCTMGCIDDNVATVVVIVWWQLEFDTIADVVGSILELEYGGILVNGIWHIISASFLWSQFLTPQPLWPHSDKDVSFPVQESSFNHTGPVLPWYSVQQPADQAPVYPNIRHTTDASSRSQPSVHMVPQNPLWYTSTRPLLGVSPPTRRTLMGRSNKRRK